MELRSSMRDRFSYTVGQGSIPWIAYVGLVVLTQSILHLIIMQVEEDKSMEKAAHQFKLFILFVLETIMTIQINAVSSVLPPVS
jgi:hypothetical protein